MTMSSSSSSSGSNSADNSINQRMELSSSSASSFPKSNSNGNGSFGPRAVSGVSSGGGEGTQTSNKRKIAPLVDSSLLRFLSQQKKVPLLLADPPSSSTTTTTTAEVPPTTPSHPFPSQQHGWNTALADEITNILHTNHNVDRNAALDAGIAVQNEANVRIRRRRIRRYLESRELAWASASEEELWNVTTKVGDDDDDDDDVVRGSGVLCVVTDVEGVLEVMMEAGLTAKDCATILAHTPSVGMMKARRGGEEEGEELRGETVEETLRRALNGVLMGTLKLRRYDARKVLRSCPGLLTKRGSHAAEQVIKLLSTLAISPKSLSRSPATLPLLLSRSPAALFRLVSFLTSDAVRMPLDKIGPLIRRSESKNLLDAVCPLPPHLSADADVTMGEVMKRQTDEVDEIYRSMWITAETLRDTVGVTDVPKVLAAFPAALLLNHTEEILPVAKFLRAELGIWYDDVPRVIESFPMLLGVDVEGMRRVASYLLELGVSEDSLGKIFRAFPSILALDVETRMRPVVEFLREIVGVEDIGRFITRIPPILGYSVEEELKPKWEYLSQVCEFDTFEVVRFPAYFSYPLDRIIQTRYEYLSEKGIPYRVLDIDAIVRFGDVEFATQIAGDHDNGFAFSMFVNERRKKNQRNKGNNDGGNGTRMKRGKSASTTTETIKMNQKREAIDETERKTLWRETLKPRTTTSSVPSPPQSVTDTSAGSDDCDYNGGSYQFGLAT